MQYYIRLRFHEKKKTWKSERNSTRSNCRIPVVGMHRGLPHSAPPLRWSLIVNLSSNLHLNIWYATTTQDLWQGPQHKPHAARTHLVYPREHPTLQTLWINERNRYTHKEPNFNYGGIEGRHALSSQTTIIGTMGGINDNPQNPRVSNFDILPIWLVRHFMQIFRECRYHRIS